MITLREITLRRGTKVVLDKASTTLQPGEKIGLVGRNGAGKSSLFALLAGRLQSDGGDVAVPARWRMAEVAQNMPETEDGATEYVLQGDTRLNDALALLAQAEADDDGTAIGDAHQAIAEAGGWDARPRAQALLMGLGFKTAQLDAPVNSFSGGWRMRLQLARALMCPADLMLLDEPTNHLDLDALVWLEAWLQRYDGTLIVISHDREFLDAITRVTLHLDSAQLTRYTGNYTAFEDMRAERMLQQQAGFQKQQERIAHLQTFIDRFKAKASKAKQAQSRVKALARMERLAPVLTSADFNFEFREPVSLPNPMLSMDALACGYMVPPVAEVMVPPVAGVMVPPVAGYGDAPPEGVGTALGRPGGVPVVVPPVAEVMAPPVAGYGDAPPEGVGTALGRPGGGPVMVPPVARYGDAPPEGAGTALGRPVAPGKAQAITIVRDVSRSVLAGQRIGILGANGQGKSTLVKTIAHAQPAVGGTMTEGKGLAIGYFAQQELDVLSLNDTPLLHMVRLARDVGPAGREQELRNFLGQFRFDGTMVNQAVGTLSGGEKARLVLAMLVWQRPNLLLLDEPTNHLDLDTREALSMALNGFEGTVMLVSHDRALLREVCDEFWLVTGGGVQPFDGDLDDYQRWLLDTAKADAKAARTAAGKSAAMGAPAPTVSKAAAQVEVVKDTALKQPALPRGVPPRSQGKATAAERQQRNDEARPLRREIGEIDARLAALALERASLEAALTQGRMASSDLAAKGRQLKAVTSEVDRLEGRWLELSTRMEQLAGIAPGT